MHGISFVIPEGYLVELLQFVICLGGLKVVVYRITKPSVTITAH